MDNSDLHFSLVAISNSFMERQTTDKILACNKELGKYGLALTEQQALALAQTRTNWCGIKKVDSLFSRIS